MGTYLSKPVLDKHSESDVVLGCPTTPLAWACVDMQGWRKTMEDAHVADTIVSPPPKVLYQSRHDALSSMNNNSKAQVEQPEEVEPIEDIPVNQNENAKVFAVFDGHGGAEVAKFCDRYLVEVLVKQSKWQKGDIGGALVDSFHELDRMIDHPARKDELIQLKLDQMHIGAAGVNNPVKPPNLLKSNNTNLANAPLLSTPRGTIADMIKHPFQQRRGKKDKDPNSIQQLQLQKKQEETCLNDAAESTAGKTQVLSNEERNKIANEVESVETKLEDKKSTSEDKPVAGETEEINDESIEEVLEPENEFRHSDNSSMDICETHTGKLHSSASNGITNESMSINGTKLDEAISSSNDDHEMDCNDAVEDSTMTPATDDNKDVAINSVISEKVGPTTEMDEKKSMNEDESAQSNDTKITHSRDAKLLIEKLLAISESVDKLESEKRFLTAMGARPLSNTLYAKDTSDIPKKESLRVHEYSSMTPTDTPSRIQNGRQICNLPDHPIHAGCTSIVIVMVERVLTVANAGDSRAVLCRKGGIPEALSIDHKPMQPREMSRITKAGGFINHFGRINGNLNLSRSIGDLKYKQTAGLPPSKQMITAEPDITQVKIQEGDEFIILGCDGIWDCLTNEEAVQYVRERIDTKSPEEIGIEMLDTIVSVDPKTTQGIGGDNMTVLIVDLLPHTRQYIQELTGKKVEEK